jgi:hypothetical protein
MCRKLSQRGGQFEPAGLSNLLEQNSGFYRPFHRTELFQCQRTKFLININDDVTNGFIGLQVLSADVDVGLR